MNQKPDGPTGPCPRAAIAAIAAALLMTGTAAIAAIAPLPFWHSSLSHKAWARPEGAPSAANAIVQDDTGMLWFAAANGLYRFDGVRFELVDDVAGNKLRSPNVQALSIFGDEFWLGYTFGGISVFKHGAARHYGVAEGLPSASINRIARTADGTMWAATPTSTYWLDGARWRQVMPADGVPEAEQSNFIVLQDGTLLIHHTKGLYRSVPGTHRFRHIDGPDGVTSGQVNADGKVILMRLSTTHYQFDPVSEKSTPLRLPDAKAEYYSINQDRRNAWWIGLGDGMRMYTPDFKLKKFLPAPQTFSGVAGYVSPFDDREGNLWFMTENGVDRIRETRLTVPDMPFRGMDFSLAAGDRGEVWVSGNTTLYDMAPRAFAIAPDGHRIPSTMPGATASARSADGSQWFGNFKYVWQRRDGKVRQWPLPAAISGIDLQAMAVADDGSLWVSVLRRGVYTFKDGVWLDGGGHPELAKQTAVSLHADSQGRLWIGYVGNAIAVLEHGVIRRFGPAEGLAVGNALTIFSQRGTLWVGGDQGLAHFDNGRFVMLNDSAGRPFTGVSGIVETKAGELWLHGANGLVRIGAADLAAARAAGGNRVAAELFDHLDGHEGAPQLLRPLNTLIEAGDGRLWYSTVSSVGWIDPQRIARNRLAPTPLITWLNTDSQRYRAINGLALPMHTRYLQIDFTAAVLSVPERARFRTRLVGQDHAWRESAARQTFYTNLGPGDYRFEVMAANEDGLWSLAPASISFRIAPAFYQTSWFKLACGALLAGALYLLYVWRLSRITARVLERMRARLDERERIARTLHDTFLQSVHGLSLRFHSIKAGLPREHEVQQQIDAALDAADAVVEEGREQLMDLRVNHACNGELAPVLNSLGIAAAAQHGARFSLQEEGTRRLLQADVQDELFAIAREAIANALQHSGSTEVMVQLTYASTAFTMAVRDYGKGLDDEVYQAGQRERHWGLTGMRERAARIGAKLQIHSTPGTGTNVVVTLGAALAYR